MKMPMYQDLTDEDIDKIIYFYELKYGSKTFEPGITITNKKINDSWLLKKKKIMSESDHEYETRYGKYLIEKRYGEQAKNSILKEAEKILSFCANPETSQKTRGLVIGDVQSGKTSNYLALANMACDYGYKIILILAGMTDLLRIQTQERVDEGLIGAVSSTIGRKAQINYIGVGTQGINAHYAIPFTTDLSDFEPANCTANDLNKPQILVVKKNKRILEAVKNWLKPGQINVSGKNILIIDDECDNASINTKNDEDPSTINGLIRDIYNNFECASYVGFTATPFANIFINPDSEDGYDDLFPSDFIHRLKTTSDIYFGIDKVLRDDKRFIRFLKENEINFLPAKHKSYEQVNQISGSLKNAICTFLIGNCVRTFRGDVNVHRSMMINISPYNNVQEQIKELVEIYVVELKYAILQYTNYGVDRFIKHFELKRLHDIYINDSMFNTPNQRNNKTIREELSIEKLIKMLYAEISKFQVVLINNKTKKEEKFNYNDYKEVGARVIAVGGYVLSRGLTLEGLLVSYYNRNSSAYDTLLQMSRWFGYRPNYEDLCLIYMTHNSYDCFGAVVKALDNLDSQLEIMHVQGATPRDYGLMILQSPDTLETNLLISARNKLKNSYEIIKGLNYSGVDVDTSKLFKDTSINNQNLESIKDFVKRQSKKGKNIEVANRDRYMILDVSNNDLADFVGSLKVPLENKKFNVENITDFIRKGQYYQKWDIVFATGEKKNAKLFNLYDANNKLCLSINPVKRSFSIEEEEDIIRISKNNNRLLEPGIFNAGLTEEQIEEAKEIARNRPSRKKAAGEPKTPIALDYLSVADRKPLFVILPILLFQDEPDIEGSDYSDEKVKIIEKFSSGEWLMGFGIGFAERDGKVMMSYRINKIMKDEYLRKIREEDFDD